ncbi:MAG TPA: hypothetical protein VFX98_04610 [Longimicrobiaceae bacterium]|nr:hypothetical protein [Longimicrobiaceae bacterium]
MTGVAYRLRMPEPHSHLFQVEVRAEGVRGPAELVMPSWTPGSYLMREFPRNVQDFRAEDGAGRALAWEKTDKNTWRVAAPADGALVARYAVYANEISVRTSHLDATHGYVNGASVFVYLAGREREPVELEVEKPENWRVTTALPGEGSRFRAEHYDHLVDSPLEIGQHTLIEWQLEGKRHRYAIWGQGNYDPRRLVADTSLIVQAEKALFGGELPYPAFTFIVHAVPGASGGLEHRESTSLLVDRWTFRGPLYEQFLGLVALEFFHVGNGKRIRPEGLGPFDYTHETYTRELWVVEGFTTYYTDLLLRRSGMMPRQRYLDKLGEMISRFQQLPGRRVQSLEEASFDAWIKFYRPDAHTPNAQVSYYQKGALVALLLDLTLRGATDNRRSLDDLLRILWERYGKRDEGYPAGRVEALASELAGTDLRPHFDRWLRSTDDLEFDEALAVAGLQVVPAGEGAPVAPARSGSPAEPGAERVRTEVRTGIQFKYEGGKILVSHVLAGTPAFRAGVNDGDELVTLTMEVESGPPARLVVRPVPEPTERQQLVLEHWLRTDVPQVRVAGGGGAGGVGGRGGPAGGVPAAGG